MAWTSPRTWTAAEVVTAAIMNVHVRDNLKAIGDPWTAYVPVLANWTQGNGTLTGFVRTVGKSIDFYVEFTFGSTSVATGVWQVTLPATGLHVGTVGMPIDGVGWAFDTSATTNNYYMTCFNAAGNSVNLRNPAAGALVTATVPYTWATGDKVIAMGSYESA